MKRWTFALFALAAACSEPAASRCGSGVGPALRFVEVAAQAGLAHRQARSRPVFGCTLIDVQGTCGPVMTGGAAAGDVDGDGWPDLVFTRWDAPILLYLNQRDGTFRDVGAEVGLHDAPERLAHGNGALLADLNGDGDLDLYVTTLGGRRFLFYENGLVDGLRTATGLPRFREEALSRGLALASDAPDGTTWGMSASAGDFDRDGALDVHTTEWRRYEGADAGLRGRVRLLRNLGAGAFEDVTARAGVLMSQGFGDSAWEVRAFTSAFADMDDDGWPELLVASDFFTSRLFWNRGDGTFEDGTVAAGVNKETNAMGAAVGDADGDGRLDWFVDSIHDPDFVGTIGNRLYRNAGARRFDDVTDDVGTIKEGHWAWGTTFFDPDNDGDLDVALTNGMDLGQDERYLADPLRFWENRGGRFVERSAEVGLVDRGDGKGLLALDYDRDGDEDLLVVNAAGPPRLFRNDTPLGNAWLEVSLRGPVGNTRGIGATVRVTSCGRILVRAVSGSSTFLATPEAVAHVGLGPGVEVVERVEVRWPDGRVEQRVDVPSRRPLVLTAP